MGAQIILNQRHLLGVWIHLFDDIRDDFGPFQSGMLIANTHLPPPAKRLHHHEDIRRAFTCVFVILMDNAMLICEGSPAFPNQLSW